MLTESSRLPHDPEARTLIVGYSIAGLYAILSWSQVLIWPASQAPFCKFFCIYGPFRAWQRPDHVYDADKYAWELSIVFWVLVIVLSCRLHMIDRRHWFR